MVRYMAPEIMRGHKPSQASDIFSLAMLLNETLTGQPPYANLDNDSAVTHAVTLGERPETLDPFSSSTRLLVELIRSMWADDPKARPDATEVFAKAGTSVRPLCIVQPTYSQLALFRSSQMRLSLLRWMAVLQTWNSNAQLQTAVLPTWSSNA